MPKLKVKRKPRIKTPKSRPEVIDASTLDIDVLFEEATAPERKKSSRARKRTKSTGSIDEVKRLLIKRIKKIYKDNGYKSVGNLESQPTEQLRIHLNHLQWGLAKWITRKDVIPDPPDEYPENGFQCVTSTHKVWTNSTICQMRIQYSSLYPSCGGCSKWSDHEPRNKTDSSDVLSRAT
jgi:hypothetical protein